MITRRTIITGAATVAAAGILPARAEDICKPFLRTDQGPFYPRAEIPAIRDLTRAGAAKGEAVYVFGVVKAPDCALLEGADVVIWQADDNGEYLHPNSKPRVPLDENFRYFARCTVGADGFYWFKTIAPKPYDFQGIERARHFHFEVKHSALGRLTSEMYFAGGADDARRVGDVVWRSRDADHRAGLIVEQKAPADFAGPALPFSLDAPWCRFDIGFLPTA